MNPMLPIQVFIPDGEAHKMPDGRLYLYGSQDIRDGKEYGSDRYHVFSTADMETWTDHGESFRINEGLLYAPDCAHKDGKYILYYCTGTNGEYTAVSDSPAGPFVDPRPLEGAHGTGIDPSVLVDDDGQAYYFWGQFALKGARLCPDMRSLDLSTLTECIITEENDGFHEGSSIRKRGDIYYLVYADITRGRPTCLSYATSLKPLGPYVKRGVIVDNISSDPEVWNDHGSIEELNGQWYVFYHRSSRNGKFSRRACCEKISFDENGLIREVEMTTQGASSPIDAFTTLPAWRACRVQGGAYARTDGETGEALTNCVGSDFWPGWAEYKYLDFGGGAEGVRIEARGKGRVRVCLEDRRTGAEIRVDSEEFTSLAADFRFPGGVHPVRLFFVGHMEIRSLQFLGK